MPTEEKDTSGFHKGGVMFTPHGPEPVEGSFEDFANCFGEPDFTPEFNQIEVMKDGLPMQNGGVRVSPLNEPQAASSVQSI